MTAIETKLRVMISRHNKQHGADWHVAVEPTGFKVWGKEGVDGAKRPATPETAIQQIETGTSALPQMPPNPPVVPPSVPERVEDQQPTNTQFVNYLALMSVGASFTLDNKYAHRFEELVDWLLAANDLGLATWDYEHNEEESTLKIIRRA